MNSTIGIRPSVAVLRELVHPERLRIFATLSGERRSRLELLAELSDIAATTLFRHLARLLEAGLIEIVEERQVGANVERVYGAVPFDLPGDERQHLTADDYLAMVTAITTDLIATVQVVSRSHRGLRGRSTFGQQNFHCTDAEYHRIEEKFDAFLDDLKDEFSAGPGRSARTLTYGMCPRRP